MFLGAAPRYEFIGNDRFKVLVEFGFLTDHVKAPRDGRSAHWIEEGFESDGPSIPKWIRWYLNRLDKKVFDAAVVHDWFIANRKRNGWTRKQCDLVFKEALESRGVSKWKCVILYNGVRAWAKWNRYD